MSTESWIAAEDAASCGSAPGSPNKNRVKFLCSHGGKILPRPADGHLKYVGGETRVISVHRDIKFTELMKKLTYLIEDDMILKYQLVPEDLDALVSVKNDEDLRYMFNEHDHYGSSGKPRLRAFLFPAKPIVMEHHIETHPVEQRYIDAINGIVRSSPSGMIVKHHPTPNGYSGASFGIPSACSSPRSSESCNTEVNGHEALLPNNYHIHSSQADMQRVQSSPNVYNLTGLQHSNAHGHQVYPQNYYQISRQPHQGYHYTSKPLMDPHKSAGPERLISVRSVGRADGTRYQVDHAPVPYQSPRHTRNSGCFSRCVHFDDYIPGSDGRMDRGSSLPPSPVPLSPRQSHVFVNKVWDSAIRGES